MEPREDYRIPDPEEGDRVAVVRPDPLGSRSDVLKAVIEPDELVIDTRASDVLLRASAADRLLNTSSAPCAVSRESLPLLRRTP